MSRQEANVIYVGNIPYEWDEQTVKAIVSQAPNVVELRMGFDYEGKNKGFGFVEFRTPLDAEKGIQYLGQVKIMTAGGRFRQFKIDYSKEGARVESSHKPIIRIDRSVIPPNVIFPDSVPTAGQFAPRLPSMPPAPKFNYNNNNNNNSTNNTNGFNKDNSGMGTPQPQGSQAQMPQNLTSARLTLPQPAKLPFTAPDNISETLSKIQPIELIELIANLKDLLNSSNPGRAADVFQLSQDLAPATAQALLLMGLIDSDVIQNSMKATPVTNPQRNYNSPRIPNMHPQQHPQYAPSQQQQQSQQPQQPQFQPQSQQPQYQPQNHQPQYQQYQHPPKQYQQQPQSQPQSQYRSPQLPQLPQAPRQNYGQQNQQNFGLPPPPQVNSQNAYNNANANRNPGAFPNNYGRQPPVNSKWPTLPPHTVAKLQAMSPNEADLIASVLSLPIDQIKSLPADKQSMVSNIRAQYL